MTKILGPPAGYTDLIDYCMSEDDFQKFKTFPLRPSSAGKCARLLAHELMEYRGYGKGPEDSKTPSVKRLLNLGSSIEWHSIRNLDLIPKKNQDFRIKYKQQAVTLFKLNDIKGKPQELIEGSIDLAIIYQSRSGGIIDIKSAKDAFHKAYRTKWDGLLDRLKYMKTTQSIGGSETAWWVANLSAFLEELNDPFFADNFHQVNTYCCSEWAKQHGIDHGSIYRYNKNDSRHIEIRFKPDQTLYDQFVKKCNLVNKAVADKTPDKVPCEYIPGSIKKAFCPLCKNEDNLKAYLSKFKEEKVFSVVSGELKKLFDDYEALEIAAEEKERLHMKLISELSSKKIKHVKLENGHIYELKFYKSKKPNLQLIRSKE